MDDSERCLLGAFLLVLENQDDMALFWEYCNAERERNGQAIRAFTNIISE